MEAIELTHQPNHPKPSPQPSQVPHWTDQECHVATQTTENNNRPNPPLQQAPVDDVLCQRCHAQRQGHHLEHCPVAEVSPAPQVHGHGDGRVGEAHGEQLEEASQ